MKAVLPALARPMLEPHLPAGLEIAWFASPAEANAMIADADIAWVDMQPTSLTAEAIRHGERLKWVSTIYAGLDAFPLVCLHAASMGVPVVAFAGNGGVEAMFGDAFMGAPYPDMVALTRVLDRLDDAADRARVGVAQRAIVEARWSSAVAAPRLHDHLVAAVAEDHR